MSGQLWQECDCGTEPVCLDCEKCDRHCTCEQAKDDAEQVTAFEKENPGFLDKLQQHCDDGAREY